MASKSQHLSIISLELSNPLAEMRNAGLVCSVGHSAPGGADVVVWGGHRALWVLIQSLWLRKGRAGPWHSLSMGLLGRDGARGVPSEPWVNTGAFCSPAPLGPSLTVPKQDNTHGLYWINQPQSLLCRRQTSPASGGSCDRDHSVGSEIAALPVWLWLVVLLSQQVPGDVEPQLFTGHCGIWGESAQGTRIALESSVSPLGRHCLVENLKIQC